MPLAFYMDVHVPRAVAVALRLRGIDVLTAQQDGSAELDDASLLRRASSCSKRMSILFSGIVYAHQLRTTIGQLLDDLELLAKATVPEEWSGRIEYLPLD